MMACTSCRTTAVSCRRCGVSVCADHLALDQESCVDCAVAYYDSLDRVHMRAWFAAGFVLPWALYVAVLDQLPSWSVRSGGYRAITTGVPALDVVIMFAITAVFTGKAAMRLRRSLHRRSFMTRPLPRANVHG